MQRNEQEQQNRKSEIKTAIPSEQRSEVSTTIATTQEEQREQEQLLTTEQQKAEEYLNQLQRTQADFVNYRRRASKEQAEGRIAAQSMVLSSLLPVLDDLELALRAAPAEMSAHPWVQGLFLVAQRLKTQLDRLGVQRIGASGEPFDPRWHEAITTEARADVPEGTIVHVFQLGYVLGERVIRPAQVSVAGNPSPVINSPATAEESPSSQSGIF